MVEITDRDSLERWLEGKPREVCVAIAARAASRTLPFVMRQAIRRGLRDTEAIRRGLRDTDLTLVSLRATLIAVVAAYVPTAVIRAATANAANAAAAAADAANAARDDSAYIYNPRDDTAYIYAAYAVVDAVDGTYVADATDVAASAVAVDAVNGAATAVVWRAISGDLDLLDNGANVETLLATPLWHAENPLQAEWEAARKRLHARPEDWSFWIDWYQRVLDGRPQNWDMLEEIALIGPDDWDKGAAHVNGLIAKIQAKYLQKATPYAERIELNPETNRLRSVPVTLQNPRLYQTALDKVRDALDDMRPDEKLAQHHIGLTKIVKRLDRSLDTYRDNPQRVHDDFLLSAKQIAGLVTSGEVADDEDVDALKSALITGADDIRAADEEVKASVAARVRLRAEEMRIEDAELVAEALEAVAEVAEGELHESLTEDAEFFRELHVHAKEGNAPPLGGADHNESVDRLFRVSAQISRTAAIWDASKRVFSGLVTGDRIVVIGIKIGEAINVLLGLLS